MDGVLEVIAGKIRSHFPIIHQKSRRVSEALEEDRTSLQKSLSRMMRDPADRANIKNVLANLSTSLGSAVKKSEVFP